MDWPSVFVSRRQSHQSAAHSVLEDGHLFK